MRRIFPLALLAALLAFACAPAVAQNIQAISVNLGGAWMLQAEASGTAAPSGACVSLSEYVQTAGVNNSAKWLCVGGAWYQQTGSGSVALTTTGTSGAATLSAGTLNIPQYQAALGYTPADSGANSDITSLSALSTPLSAAQGGTGVTAVQGNGSKVQLSLGSPTGGDCAKFDMFGNVIDAGAACGSGGGGVNTGTVGLPAVYATSTTVGSAATLPAPVLAPALGSNSLPPASHYVQPPINGLYLPLLQNANLTTTSGITNASTGLVATTAGTTGTGTIVLPQPIDPTKPWNLAVHVVANDSSHLVQINLLNPAGAYSGTASGFTWVLNNGNLSMEMGAANTTYGNLVSIPAGTGMTFVADSDGVGVWGCVIPDTVATVPLGMVTYNQIWDNGVYCGETSVNYIDPTYGVLDQGLSVLQFQSSSATTVITGVLLSQGRLAGSPDGKMLAPMYLDEALLGDAGYPNGPGHAGTNVYTQIFVPGNYGSPNGNPVILYHHQNANYQIHAGALATVGTLLNAGYIVVMPAALPPIGPINDQTTTNGNDYANGVTSNWGSPFGLLWRRTAVDWVRANLPSAWQLFHLGVSMGCVNALNYEKMWPGSAGIACVSGVTNLVNGSNSSWSQSGTGVSNLASIIQKGFGDWYVTLQPSTNQTPPSSGSNQYWNHIGTTSTATNTNAPGAAFLQYPNYQFVGVWHTTPAYGTLYTPGAGTIYTTQQLVNTMFSGSASALNSWDPSQNGATYVNVPIMANACSATWNAASGYDGAIYALNQAQTLQTAVAAAGGSMTVNSITNNYSGTAAANVTSFYVASNVAYFTTSTNAFTAGMVGNFTTLVNASGYSIGSMFSGPGGGNGPAFTILASPAPTSTSFAVAITWPNYGTSGSPIAVTSGTFAPMSCGHMTPDLYLPSTLLTFFGNRVKTQAAAQFATQPPIAPVAPTGYTGNQAPLTRYVQNASSQGTSFANLPYFSWPIAAKQVVYLDCKFVYQTSATTGGLQVQLTGPALGSTSTSEGMVTGAGLFQTALTSGVPTFQAPVAAWQNGYPALTPTGTTIGASSTNYPAEFWFTVNAGPTAGLLQLQFASNASGTVTVEPGSRCVEFAQ